MVCRLATVRRDVQAMLKTHLDGHSKIQGLTKHYLQYDSLDMKRQTDAWALLSSYRGETDARRRQYKECER